MKPKTILLTTLMTAGTLGCAGDLDLAGPPGPPGAPATVERAAASAREEAFAGLGGKGAVAALASFRIQATGERLMTLEGFTPFDGSQLISTFTSDVTDDVAGDRLRIAYERKIPLFGATTDYRVIVRGNLAATDGVESVFGAPGGALLSDRWASAVRQHRFLNPQLLLRDVALGKLTAANAGSRGATVSYATGSRSRMTCVRSRCSSIAAPARSPISRPSRTTSSKVT